MPDVFPAYPVYAPETRNVDLHTHTTASDGDQSPTQLVALAKAAGLAAIAVTDHDTTDGLREAIKAGKNMGIEVVPGIELSVQIDRGQCHILGLGIDPENAPLLTRLYDIQQNRINRNALMVEKFNALGIPMTLAEVEAIAGGDIVARPHFARLLIQKGVVSTVQQAFDEYLADGARANLPKEKVTPEEAIHLIHGAGGVAILAHPNNLKRDAAETESKIRELQQLGLDGIEARYNLHAPEETARYLTLTERLHLLTGGGSDFHGPTVKPKVMLGHVEGDQPAPYGTLLTLKERLQSS